MLNARWLSDGNGHPWARAHSGGEMITLFNAYLVVVLACGAGTVVALVSASDQEIVEFLDDDPNRLARSFSLVNGAIVRLLGHTGVWRTLLSVALVYSIALPPLTFLFLPKGFKWDPTSEGLRSQWMLVAAYEIWLWSNVLCDTAAFLFTRRIVGKVQSDLGRQPRVPIIAKAIGKLSLVCTLCLVLAACGTAVAYVLEMRHARWLGELWPPTLDHAKAIFLDRFYFLNTSFGVPAHLYITSASYMLTFVFCAGVPGLLTLWYLWRSRLRFLPRIAHRFRDKQTQRQSLITAVIFLTTALTGIGAALRALFGG